MRKIDQHLPEGAPINQQAGFYVRDLARLIELSEAGFTDKTKIKADQLKAQIREFLQALDDASKPVKIVDLGSETVFGYAVYHEEGESFRFEFPREDFEALAKELVREKQVQTSADNYRQRVANLIIQFRSPDCRFRYSPDLMQKLLAAGFGINNQDFVRASTDQWFVARLPETTDRVAYVLKQCDIELPDSL